MTRAGVTKCVLHGKNLFGAFILYGKRNVWRNFERGGITSCGEGVAEECVPVGKTVTRHIILEMC